MFPWVLKTVLARDQGIYAAWSEVQVKTWDLWFASEVGANLQDCTLNSKKSVRTKLNCRTLRGLVCVGKPHTSGFRNAVSVGRKITEWFFPFHMCNYFEASSCPHFLSHFKGNSCYNKIQLHNEILTFMQCYIYIFQWMNLPIYFVLQCLFPL